MEEEKKKMELCVPSDSIIREYDFGSYKFVDTQTGILFHIKGGYDLFVQPRMASLYQHLRYFLDNYDRTSEMEKEEKELYDVAYSATIANLEIPLFMASSDKALFDIANVALENLNEMAESALNADLKPETPEENGEFERAMDAIEELSKPEVAS